MAVGASWREHGVGRISRRREVAGPAGAPPASILTRPPAHGCGGRDIVYRGAVLFDETRTYSRCRR